MCACGVTELDIAIVIHVCHFAEAIMSYVEGLVSSDLVNEENPSAYSQWRIYMHEVNFNSGPGMTLIQLGYKSQKLDKKTNYKKKAILKDYYSSLSSSSS